MKLYYSATAPYVRKEMIVAIETGQLSALECVTTAVVPVSSAGHNTFDLAPTNPLAKVPTLETDDGLTLFDSRVICEYLDAQHAGERLFPQSARQRRLALRDQALGYRDFRFTDSPWRATRPKLAHWFEQTSERGSLRETVVPDTAA